MQRIPAQLDEGLNMADGMTILLMIMIEHYTL